MTQINPPGGKRIKNSINSIGFWTLCGLGAVLTICCLVSVFEGDEVVEETEHLKDRISQTTKPDKTKTDTKPDPKAVKGKNKDKDKNKGKAKNKAKEDPRGKRISARNIFSPQKKSAVFKLVGVLGKQVFFQGSEGLTVGQSHNGGKIKEIGPDWVELEVEGKSKKIYVFTPGSSPSLVPGSPGGKMRMMSKMRGRRGPASMPPGFKLTQEMIEKFKTMPSPMREEAMQKLPPEFQAQLRKAL